MRSDCPRPQVGVRDLQQVAFRVFEIEGRSVRPLGLVQNRNTAVLEMGLPSVVNVRGSLKTHVNGTAGAVGREFAARTGRAGAEEQQDAGPGTIEQAAPRLLVQQAQAQDAAVERLGPVLVRKIQNGLENTREPRSGPAAVA